MHVCRQDDVWDVVVNDDWNMANLREFLGLRLALTSDFSFVIDNSLLHKRKEGFYLCKSIPFPRCIHIKQVM